MQSFKDIIDECGFIDLGYLGSCFTWSRHYENGQSARERLDRELATNEWFLANPGSQVKHLSCNTSDHSPILIIPSSLDPFP